jgi:hypothetical protein
MKTLRLTVLGAALTLPGAAVMAQRPAPPSFESLDTNHDGVLSKEEVGAMFARFGRGEGRRGGQTGGPGGFGGNGGNGPSGPGGFGGEHHGGGGFGGAENGGRPRGERPNLDQIFARWDTDHNGTISKAEFDARPRFGGRRGGPPAGHSDEDLPQN